MSIFTKVGAAAAAANNDDNGGKDSPIVPFKVGSEYKVVVTDADAVAEYYGYGIFGKVNTFVPDSPPERSAKGYVTGNPSLWDQAADIIYKDAAAAKEAGNAALDEELRKEARLFRGSRRKLRAFYDLTSRKHIVVDLSSVQADAIATAIAENADDLSELAFKLAKKGGGKGTVVTLSPIIKVARDLSADEQAALAAVAEVPSFDYADFESCLYVSDREEQTKNLVIAGFPIERLGLTIGAAAAGSDTPPFDTDSQPITGDAPEINF